MSRIGKKPIPVPKGVTVNVERGRGRSQGAEGLAEAGAAAGRQVRAQGRGTRGQPGARDKEWSKFHGLARSLMANAVEGVTNGFKRELDIVGVGYRAEVKGKQVHLRAGLFASGRFDVPAGSTWRLTSRRTSR